jgi:hypothetical protein
MRGLDIDTIHEPLSASYYFRRKLSEEEIMQALIAVIAALVGIAVGFFLRNASAKSEKSLLEVLNQKLSADAEALKTQLTEAQGKGTVGLRGPCAL